MSRAKNWCFTTNNYSDADQDNLRSLAAEDFVQYLVYGREVGESGTPHLQGYVEFTIRKTFNQARNLLPRGSHLEVRRGTGVEAAEYCKKEEDFVEYGVMSKGQGTRTDLESLHENLKAKRPLSEISDENFKEFIKYQRGINAYRLVHSVQRDWMCSVVVYWGKTGAGKTRSVHDNLPKTEDLYIHPGGPWFDGYDQQPIALFDDFGGSEFKLSYLLKLLDRYPMRVPVKGGFVSWAPKEIYITSNKDPCDWYPNAHSEHVEALFRRFTNVVKFQ